jgi:arsenate reductase
MKRVMFLCTHNSSRSQIAEGLLRKLGENEYEVVSSGTNPTELHPYSIAVMKEIGIDISSFKSKYVGEFMRVPFDWVITVCDRAREKCPIYPLATWLHWSISDPERIEDFRAARDELLRRIKEFLRATTFRMEPDWEAAIGVKKAGERRNVS